VAALRVLLVGGPMYDPLYERLALFEEAEGITVERAVAPSHPALNERIDAEFSSGAAAYDLISTHAKYAPGQKRWLTALDDDLDDAELSDFSPQTLELARLDGALYGVPRNLDVKLLLYRTDLMDAPPASWEELLETATSLKREGLAGFAFPGKESGLFGHFFELHAMAGGAMFGEGGPPAPRLDDEAGRWALELLRDLYTRAAPKQTPDWHYDEVAALFQRGSAAMSTDWPGGFHLYEGSEEIATRFDVALYPQGSAGRYIYAGSHTFAIPRTVGDRDAAVRLLKFLTSRESQAFEARLGTLPARMDALADARSEAPEGSRSQRRWDLLARAREAALIPPKHENYPAVEDAIWRGVREVFFGKSVAAALEDTQEAARRAATKEV
jgi:multiple sugar transport system substrate-binding protein